MIEKPKTIDALLIEDNLDDSELTLYSIGSCNNHLHFAHFTSGEEALEFVFKERDYWGQPANELIKFIIIDLNLPGMNGFDIIKKLKASKQTHNIPIVVLSSSKDVNDIQVAYKIGVNSYVVKPDEFDGYLKKIGSLASYWTTVNERPN